MMGEKMIEPTDAMLAVVKLGHRLMPMEDRDIMRIALNHPDARELFAGKGARPWEPKNDPNMETIENATLDDVRTVPDLPTKPGTVIVPNDGCKAIEATVARIIWHASEAALGVNGRWNGVWRGAYVRDVTSSVLPEHINLATCKVEDQ